MKTEYDDIVESLHKLADWVEKDNHLQCHCVPRKAAYLIDALQQDNAIMKIQLMKGSYTIKEHFQMFIGRIILMWYMFRSKKKKKKNV